jgi:hypothetical protein
MMKTHVIVLVVLFACINVYAQVNSKVAADSLSKSLSADSIAWKYRAIVGAGLNLVELSNWTGGGQDAITIRGLLLGSLDYAVDRFSWENDIDVGYSITKLGKQSFRKADDRIIGGTKASLKQTDWLRYTGFVEFRTQFYVGYNYEQPDSTSPSGFTRVSDIMAPAFLTASLGAEWTPAPQFRVLAAPIASRTVFVLDDALSAAGAFGVEKGRNIRTDMGAMINVTTDWEVVYNVRWNSSFIAFYRYAMPDLWVVTWDNAIIMKVNKFLSVSFLTSLFYDDLIPVLRDDGTTGPATQIKNQLSIDIAYQITNF